MDRHLNYFNDKVDAYKQELDAQDKPHAREVIEDKIQHQEANKKRYERIEKELEESRQTQLSKVDPDARSVVLHCNIVNVGYTIQAGCDSKHKLFVNAQTGDVNDTHALAPMALEAKELLGLESMNTLTDKGYTTSAQIAQCTQNNSTTFSSPKEHSSQKNGLYDMHAFVYNAKQDTYTCPANNILHTNTSVYQKGKHRVEHYKTKAYKGCSLRSEGTQNKNERFIERGIYQEELENNAKRLNKNPDYYRERQQITEHQFGTLKRQWGFTHTLMRGKENVLTEVYLNFSIYNLLRAITLYSSKGLIAKLKELRLYFLSQKELFEVLLRMVNFSLCSESFSRSPILDAA